MRSGLLMLDGPFWDGRLQEELGSKLSFLACMPTIAIAFDKQSTTQSTRVKIMIPSIGLFCRMELYVGWRRAEVCTWILMVNQRDFWESASISLPENRRNWKQSNGATSSVISVAWLRWVKWRPPLPTN